MSLGDIGICGDCTYGVTTDLSASQYCAVTYATGQLIVLSTTNDQALGILQDNPSGVLHKVLPSGFKPTVGTVRESGHSKAKMASSGSDGAYLKVVDSSGRLGTGSLGGSDNIIAQALESWSADNQIIEVRLMHNY